MNYIESDCTIKHEGKSFTAGGAVVTPEILIAYPSEGGKLCDWHGNVIGTWREISRRPAIFFGHRSMYSSTYHYMRATVGGRSYSLRGFGIGMIARGKAIKA